MNAVIKLDVAQARAINEQHRLARSHAESAVRHAVECGKLLIDMKRQLSHGEFAGWVGVHCEFSYRTARAYMQAARQSGNGVANFVSLRDVLGYQSEPATRNDWYTPSAYVESVRAVLGAIDLDPATSAEAQATVRAEHYFTKQSGSLHRPWRGRTFLNPPYCPSKLCGQFVSKLLAERAAGNVTEAVLLLNNSTDASYFQQAARSASLICLTDHRIKFAPQGGEPKDSALQGQAFIYYGERPERFAAEFAVHGLLMRPWGQS